MGTVASRRLAACRGHRLDRLGAARGDLERAREESARALAARPDYAPAQNNLAYVLVLLGRDLEAARRHAEHALEASPDNPDYLLTRARVLWAPGEAAGARRDVEAVLRQRPNSRSARTLRATIENGRAPAGKGAANTPGAPDPSSASPTHPPRP